MIDEEIARIRAEGDRLHAENMAFLDRMIANLKAANAIFDEARRACNHTDSGEWVN
jgi:cell division protein FtsB